jgi:hypothetical protein
MGSLEAPLSTMPVPTAGLSANGDQHLSSPFAGDAPDGTFHRQHRPNAASVAFNADHFASPGSQSRDLDRDFFIPLEARP